MTSFSVAVVRFRRCGAMLDIAHDYNALQLSLILRWLNKNIPFFKRATLRALMRVTLMNRDCS